MKKITVIACLLALLTLSACGAQTLPADEKDVPPVEGISQTQEDGQTGTKVVYIPMWMQDYSVVYYDAHLNRTVESGGDLTEEEINSREDIFPEEMYTIAAEPNTRGGHTPPWCWAPRVYPEYLLPGRRREVLSRPGHRRGHAALMR